ENLVRLPREPVLPSVMTVARQLATNEQFAESTTLTFAEPGYYRIAAAVWSPRSAALKSQHIQDVAIIERWIWVSEANGQVTEEFDRFLFPEGAITVPGPLRFSPHLAAASAGASDIDLNSMNLDGCIDGYLTYTDGGFGNIQRPLPRAQVKYVIIDKIVGNSEGQTSTDANGYYIICHDGSVYAYVDANFYLDGTHVFDADTSTIGRATGDDKTINVASTSNSRSNVYFGIDYAASRAPSTFSRPIPAAVKSRIDPAASNSYYAGLTEGIVIADEHVWGSHGAFVHGHEHGHYFDQRYFTLLGDLGFCPSPHEIWVAYNYSCALTEGWADYYGVFLRGSDTGMLGSFENPPLSAGTDGAAVEGAFAAFLFDMTDSANDGADIVNFGGAFIADVQIGSS
ncbi:MAG: hypothetical protein ACT443_01245, partial [Gemmatimonadota bacterium]